MSASDDAGKDRPLHHRLARLLEADRGALSVSNPLLTELAEAFASDPSGEWVRCADVLKALGGGIFTAVRKAVKQRVREIERKREARKRLGTRNADGTCWSGPYKMDPDGTHFRVGTDDGQGIYVPIANCVAFVEQVVDHDNGTDIETYIDLRVVIGHREHLVRMLPEDLARGDWVAHLVPLGVIVEASRREHVRAAIQHATRLTHPNGIPHRRVFTHLGWRKVEGEWVFLHAGGAIGSSGDRDDVELELDDPLDRFLLELPESQQEARAAVRKLLELLGLAPMPVTATLLAGIAYALLAGSGMTIWIAGMSGVLKSSLAAVFQACFGRSMWSDTSLPASASSTGISNMALIHQAANAFVVVDDFAPDGGRREQDRQAYDVTRLVRSAGNRSPRRRARRDGKLARGMPPRGLPVVTAENSLPGRSARARTVSLELRKGDVDLERLTQAQRLASDGVLAQAVGAFVQWLAPRLDAERTRRLGRARKLRDEYAETGAHQRSLSCVADLLASFETFLAFATDIGALSRVEAVTLLREHVRPAMTRIIALQRSNVADQAPAVVSLRALAASIVAQRAYVSRFSGEAPRNPEVWGWVPREVSEGDEGAAVLWQPRGDHVGWIDGDVLYLHPGASFAAITRHLAVGGSGAQVSDEQRLGAALQQSGLLLRREELNADDVGFERGRTTVRLKRVSNRPRVWALAVTVLAEAEAPDSVLSDTPWDGGVDDDR